MHRVFWAILALTLAISLVGAACGTESRIRPPVTTPEQATEASKASLVTFASVLILNPEEESVVATLSILPKEVTLNPGQTVILNAVALDLAGAPVSNVRLRWTMQDARAGTVNSGGVFTAGTSIGTFPGAVQVLAIQEGKKSSYSLSAEAAINIVSKDERGVLSFVGIYPSAVTVQPGQFIGLGALGWDAQGHFLPGLKFEWTMKDSKAGSVDSFGFLTAGDQVGEYPRAVKVRATQSTSRGVVAVENFVSVSIGKEAPEGVLKSVEIIPHAVFLEPGEETLMFARAFDGNSRPLRDVAFDWRVVEPKAGNIDDTGHLVAGSDAGTYPEAVQVVVTQTSNSGEVLARDVANVTVTRPRVESRLASAHILPSNVTLSRGQRFIFTAAALSQEGEEIPVTDLKWSVTAPLAGSIDQLGVFSAGRRSGIFPNAVLLRVTQEIGGETRVVEARATVNVVGDLVRVAVRPAQVVVRPGQSVLLGVSGYDANDLGVGPLRMTWSMEDPVAGSIDSVGQFTASDHPGEYVDAIRVVVTLVES